MILWRHHFFSFLLRFKLAPHPPNAECICCTDGSSDMMLMWCHSLSLNDLVTGTSTPVTLSPLSVISLSVRRQGLPLLQLALVYIRGCRHSASLRNRFCKQYVHVGLFVISKCTYLFFGYRLPDFKWLIPNNLTIFFVQVDITTAAEGLQKEIGADGYLQDSFLWSGRQPLWETRKVCAVGQVLKISVHFPLYSILTNKFCWSSGLYRRMWEQLGSRLLTYCYHFFIHSILQSLSYKWS